MASDRTFELGLVMAGAISAGAYTAGVLDFLFEALDAYEDAKLNPGWDGPTHAVRVPVMTGASAGGMTSADLGLRKPFGSATNHRCSRSSLDRLDTAPSDARTAGQVRACCDVLDGIVDRAFDSLTPMRNRAWIAATRRRACG